MALGAPAQWLPGPPKAIGTSTLVDVSEAGDVGVTASGASLVSWDIGSGKKKLAARLPDEKWHTLSVAPDTDGEAERAFVASDRRAVLVHLRTGRLIANWPVGAPRGNVVRAAAWSHDGRRLALLGWEVPGLRVTGETGAPVLWVDAETGTVTSQLRLPDIAEGVHGLTTLNDGRVVLGTPKRLVLLGPGPSDARTMSFENSALVGATRDGIVVIKRGAIVVLDAAASTAKEVARVRAPMDLTTATMRPGGRWVVAVERGAVIAIDLVRAKATLLSAKALKTEVVVPMREGVVAMGKKVARLTLTTSLPTELLLASLCVKGDCKEGDGRFVDLVANRTYSGAFKGGLPSGDGSLTYEDGAIYTGPFVKGRPHGVGRFLTAAGDDKRVQAVEGELRPL